MTSYCSICTPAWSTSAAPPSILSMPCWWSSSRRAAVSARPKQIKKLANDIGLQRLYLVGNKVRNEDEAKFLEIESKDIPLIGFLPADLKVQEADRLESPCMTTWRA
ncbi:MAG: hypothetical protein MZV64_35040 [Ignavibacteriales bacterium]|nr:hypothetical protein [Ignavibacteriales bacterium]